MLSNSCLNTLQFPSVMTFHVKSHMLTFQLIVTTNFDKSFTRTPARNADLSPFIFNKVEKMLTLDI